ncbi:MULTISPECIES: hypothetical protein [Pseudomonas]|uniref:DUF7878 domain-containing protein n=1 Tax=Pseudomonas soli TaxID=1306993 RepID=A0A2V4IVW5_9PSED|nr:MULTISPECIES: hypothetical protein [Pseudomonas]PYB85277.1 hypothetical protein DMX07_04595 [Pseudomonas soli]QWA29803.1 hypothetical protein KHO27_02620 [Pseudomonas sp. RC3H12]
MFVIDFDWVTLPDDMSGYNAAAFVEGGLNIEVQGELFLQVENCLLLELAVVMKQWLASVKNGAEHDFYYASMDEEEEPILALRYCSEKSNFLLESCWVEAPGPAVTLAEVIDCFTRYMKRLTDTLYSRSGYVWE